MQLFFFSLLSFLLHTAHSNQLMNEDSKVGPTTQKHKTTQAHTSSMILSVQMIDSLSLPTGEYVTFIYRIHVAKHNRSSSKNDGEKLY